MATKQAEQSARDKHSKATHSAHKDALYRHVLLACAVTATQSQDALGYFSPRAVVEPLAVILGRKAAIATFNNHLSEFCQPKRGKCWRGTDSRGPIDSDSMTLWLFHLFLWTRCHEESLRSQNSQKCWMGSLMLFRNLPMPTKSSRSHSPGYLGI